MLYIHICLKENNLKISMILKEKITKISMIYLLIVTMGGTIEVFYALEAFHRMHVGSAWLMPTSYFQSNFLRSNDLSHPYSESCVAHVLSYVAHF